MSAMVSMMPRTMSAVLRLPGTCGRVSALAGCGLIFGSPLTMEVSTCQREAGTGSPQRGQLRWSSAGAAVSGGRGALQKGQREGFIGELSLLNRLDGSFALGLLPRNGEWYTKEVCGWIGFVRGFSANPS